MIDFVRRSADTALPLLLSHLWSSTIFLGLVLLVVLLARKRLTRLKEVAERSGFPMTQLALAWALHQPQIAVVLVGGRTTAHLDQALQARTFPAPALLRELEAE